MRKMLYIGLALLIIGLLCLAWARWVEPGMLTVNEKSVFLEAWKGTGKKCRFVLASDFHLAPGEEARQKKIVDKIRELKPDFVIMPGDFCKGHAELDAMPPEQIAEGFAELARSVPVYVVLGNHDGFSDPDRLRRLFEEKGLHLMENRSSVWGREKGTPLQLSGISDMDTHLITPEQIPSKQEKEVPMILISHTPDVVPLSSEEVDLIVCGHTHGGQVCLPGGIPILSSAETTGMKYVYGLKHRGRTQVLVTRGLGMSVMDLRFCCSPEIMVVELCGKED